MKDARLKIVKIAKAKRSPNLQLHRRAPILVQGVLRRRSKVIAPTKMSMSIATQATLKVGKVAGLSRYASLGSRRVDARRFRCKTRLAF